MTACFAAENAKHLNRYQSILFLKSGAVGAEIKPAITRLMYAILAINPGKTAINPGKTLQNSTFIYFNDEGKTKKATQLLEPPVNVKIIINKGVRLVNDK